ncbi:MAG: acylneuraminate cytidylyltransferase family protein [Anaerolineales bacterium]
MSKITALVPMRHHSQRVPGKNYRPLAGKPLFHHILSTLQTVPDIEEIIVDTDSPVIKDGISKHFPSVSILDRPDHLCGDAISMNAIISHDVSQRDAEFFLQTHSTNPFLKLETISRAVDLFFSHYPEHDSLFSVTRIYTRLWDADAQAINHNPSELIQTQNLPPIYEENSCLYIFSKRGFEKEQHRIGENPLLYEMDRREAWDIDTELDFKIVACLMER